MAQKIRFQKVDSSNLSHVGYDDLKKELHVKFHNSGDKVYVYTKVMRAKYQALMSSSSIGGYFLQQIRYKHGEGEPYYD